MRRRDFLKVAAAVLPTLLSERTAAMVSLRGTAAIKRHGLQAIAPYLDTLLPPDESPGAIELDIHQYLVEHALGVNNYVELLSLGCNWLDAQAPGKQTFAQLGSSQREIIVVRLESATSGKIERQFFDRTLSDAMQFYYAHPRSWPSLGFAGPPQPVGFPDYAAAPT